MGNYVKKVIGVRLKVRHTDDDNFELLILSFE